MERGGYNYVRTDCTLSFPAVSSSALSRILRGLYRYRVDGCIGRLAGQKNRHYQLVRRKTGQHSGFAVLRRSAVPAFSGTLADTSGVDMVCRGSDCTGTAGILRDSGGQISPVCLPAHLAQ